MVRPCPRISNNQVVGIRHRLRRAYYFAFYVIERYVDPGFKFSGICSFFAYLVRKRHTAKDIPPHGQP